MPETFDSEIGDAHERKKPDSSFSTEFRGASDSLIERERPSPALDVGRGSGWIVWLILALALLGGGGYALWYWSEPIGAWIAGWKRDEAAPPAPEQPAEVVPEPAKPEPTEPEPVFEIDDSPTKPPTPVVVGGDELPVEQLDDPNKPAKIRSGATAARGGKVSLPDVNAKLSAVDTALEGCWESAIADPATKRPVSLTLRFTIKASGGASAIEVDGGAPESVQSCVRSALPSDGWPKPSDGVEANISRTWSLE